MKIFKKWSQRQKVGVKYSKSGVNLNSEPGKSAGPDNLRPVLHLKGASVRDCTDLTSHFQQIS